ncbi:hypothetical protein H5410_005573 [Solanum commersonii]|uniref:Uncharacterized protein n=1 Tax=Solanum commersonii TaxID=4109 RepID=A0A9J6A7U2_SOLCO|nr:hypothetical protein H5410_005573 [Solanum commersonii]
MDRCSAFLNTLNFFNGSSIEKESSSKLALETAMEDKHTIEGGMICLVGIKKGLFDTRQTAKKENTPLLYPPLMMLKQIVTSFCIVG